MPKKTAQALYAHVVLDRSGSMSSCRSDAIGGYNTYIEGLGPKDKVSLTLFDTGGIDTIRHQTTPTAAKIKDEEFIPRASTPLYDAIGHVVAKMDQDGQGIERKALVILTDGLENSSREHTKESIKKLIEARQAQGWLVIYLGANQDAWAVGTGLGITGAHAMTYDTRNFTATMESAGRATRAYGMAATASAGRQEATFTSQERERSVQKK